MLHTQKDDKKAQCPWTFKLEASIAEPLLLPTSLRDLPWERTGIVVNCTFTDTSGTICSTGTRLHMLGERFMFVMHSFRVMLQAECRGATGNCMA